MSRLRKWAKPGDGSPGPGSVELGTPLHRIRAVFITPKCLLSVLPGSVSIFQSRLDYGFDSQSWFWSPPDAGGGQPC